jgi:Flp pilus assembly protein TadG
MRGAASVETAVILSLFLLPLLMGLVDVSRLIFTRIAVQEAAQEGAMFAAFNETADTAAVKSQAIASISSPTLANGDIDVSCADSVRDSGPFGEVTVTVTYKVDLIFPLLGSTADVSRDAVAERFYPCGGL